MVNIPPLLLLTLTVLNSLYYEGIKKECRRKLLVLKSFLRQSHLLQEELPPRERAQGRSRARLLKKAEARAEDKRRNDDPYYCGFSARSVQTLVAFKKDLEHLRKEEKKKIAAL